MFFLLFLPHDETYDNLLDLLKVNFNVPLKQKNNNKQKSALVRFWRNHDHISLKGGKVCYNGEPVLIESVVSDIAGPESI